MRNALKLIRLPQWVKNGFVLLPIFFGGELLNLHAVAVSLIAMLAFCFVSSSIYCLNDIIDVDADRRHPVKCHRPIASGAVSIKEAYCTLVVLLILAVVLPLAIPHVGIYVSGVIAFYFLLNVAYCLKLKEYAIVDVFIISFGFVLRILAGGIASGVALSKWIVLMTFLLTLFLSFAKRRDDVLRMKDTGVAPRHNTIRYNTEFINQALTISGSVMLVSYIMYTVSPEVVANFHTDYLYLTSIFVMAGLMRYIQIAIVDKKSGDPTKVLLQDRFTQIVVLLWGLTFLLIIYVI